MTQAERICFGFARGRELRYLSHLDLLRFFQRALRRERFPVDYSRGFNPRARLGLAVPLPLGVTAAAEYADLYLYETVPPSCFIERLQRQLPAGLAVTGAGPAVPGSPSLAAQIDTAIYQAVAEPYTGGRAAFTGRDFWEKAVRALLSRETIIAYRSGRRDTRGTDIRPLILSAAVLPPSFPTGAVPEESPEEVVPAVTLILRAGSAGGVSPFVVLEELTGAAGSGLQGIIWRVHREGLYISAGDGLKTPPQAGGVRFWTKK